MIDKKIANLTVEDIEAIYDLESDFVEVNHRYSDEDFMTLLIQGAEKTNEAKRMRAKKAKE